MSITKHQRGFTMIEVLIAAFVLGVGLLGLAALQAQSLQFNYSALQRSQANILAYDIIDRIRANQSLALTSANIYNQGFGVPGSGTDCQAAAANCSTTEMAAFDIRQWKCSLGKFNGMAPCAGLGIDGPLTDGEGSVAVNVVAGRAQVTVTIRWTDNRTARVADGDNPQETFIVNTVL